MTTLAEKDYLVVVQCDIVMERCSGYYCEKAFHERTGGFARLTKEKAYRTLYMTCGGCCGRATHRKLSNLANRLMKEDQIDKSRIGVMLASCITKDNYHAPPCPHLAYLRELIAKLELDVFDDTFLHKIAQSRRAEGRHKGCC
jgi:predicted metal-binding protein